MILRVLNLDQGEIISHFVCQAKTSPPVAVGNISSFFGLRGNRGEMAAGWGRHCCRAVVFLRGWCCRIYDDEGDDDDDDDDEDEDEDDEDDEDEGEGEDEDEDDVVDDDDDGADDEIKTIMGDSITPGRNAAHQSNEDIEDIEASKLYLEYHPSGCELGSFSFPKDRVVGFPSNGGGS